MRAPMPGVSKILSPRISSAVAPNSKTQKGKEERLQAGSDQLR